MGGQLVTGYDGDDAVKGEGRGDVDLGDVGVRVGAAHESDVVHAGQLQVANV